MAFSRYTFCLRREATADLSVNSFATGLRGWTSSTTDFGASRRNSCCSGGSQIYPVVYLTGAPAAGKSSVSRALSQRVANLKIFEFGAELTKHINSAEQANYLQSDLREKSGSISMVDHIAVVDRLLLDFVAANRLVGPVLIDSHPVTKEAFGFRITPYSFSDFASLNPTDIWMLYTPPEVTLSRIAASAQGRPTITLEEASMHTQLQASVAATYGMSLGRSVELFNSSIPTEVLADELARRLTLKGCAYLGTASAADR